jgi:hypothetical protein
MKKMIQACIALATASLVLTACSNHNSQGDGNETLDTNISDSRRNTPGSVNTITGDSLKVATDSAQHGNRNQKRESM